MTIGPWPDAPGIYIPLGRSARLSCLDVIQIKGLRWCAIVCCDVHDVPLRCFGARVAGMGVVASAGAVIQVTVLSCLEGGPCERSVWLQLVSQWAGLWGPPMSVRRRTVVCFGRFGILYKCPVFVGSASVDTTPGDAGSLHFAACDCRLADLLGVGLIVCVSRDSTACLLFGVFRLFCDLVRLLGWQQAVSRRLMPRSGVTFDVELEIPWNALEAYMQLDYGGVYDLATVPHVFGLRGRRPDAAVVRVLLGRDPRSVRALVPDSHVINLEFQILNRRYGGHVGTGCL